MFVDFSLACRALNMLGVYEHQGRQIYPPKKRKYITGFLWTKNPNNGTPISETPLLGEKSTSFARSYKVGSKPFRL